MDFVAPNVHFSDLFRSDETTEENSIALPEWEKSEAKRNWIVMENIIASDYNKNPSFSDLKTARALLSSVSCPVISPLEPSE